MAFGGMDAPDRRSNKFRRLYPRGMFPFDVNLSDFLRLSA